MEKDRIKKFLAGLFFLFGTAMIVAVILTIGANKGLTEAKFPVQVLYRDVGGLAVGAPVRLSGVNVGYVSQVDFLDNPLEGRDLVATLTIYAKYKKQLEQSSRFTIATEGVLGEKVIDIRRFADEGKIDLSQPVVGEDPLVLQDSAEVLLRTAQSLTATSQSVRELVLELRTISRKTTRLLDRIESRIVEGNLFKLF